MIHDGWQLGTIPVRKNTGSFCWATFYFFFFQKLISPELWLSSASFCKAKKAIETARRRWLNSAEFPNQMIAKVHQTGKTMFSELMFYVEQHARVYILVRLDIGNKLLQVQETCLIHVLSIYAYPSVFICVISSVHIYIYINIYVHIQLHICVWLFFWGLDSSNPKEVSIPCWAALFEKAWEKSTWISQGFQSFVLKDLVLWNLGPSDSGLVGLLS